MNFLAPIGFFFALFIPAVILLYLLKLKRIDTPISSTLLWRKSLEDLKANTPFQKLKRNLLLFLQLAVLFLLTFALARPVMRLGGLQGQSFIVLIDASASMSATDVKPSRLEAAKRKAIDLVEDMSVGDRMMVISYAESARVLSPFEQSKTVLRRLIQNIQPTDTRTKIDDAFRIARSAADVAVNPEIIVFSDGQFPIPPEFSPGESKFRYVPIGETAENVGIVDLVVRKDFTLEERYEVLAGIQNTGLLEREVYVELWGEGAIASAMETSATGAVSAQSPPVRPERQLMDARKMTLPPASSEAILFKDTGAFPEKIEVVLDSSDSFEVDNRAWAIVPREKTVDVLLVTNGNYYLQRVLNLLPRVQLFTTTPVQYARPEEYDLIVFDSYAPPALIGGNYLFINSIPPLPEWTMGDELQIPAIVDWNSTHPLTRYLSFENLIVSKCHIIGTPPWVETILESRETPLIAAFQHNEIRGVVTNFDIYQSTWPRQVSFPIFFTNLINWFQSGEGLAAYMKKTGDVIALDPPTASEQKAEMILPPPERSVELAFTGGNPIYFDKTARRGIYEYRVDGALRKRFAVNLLSPEESAILPKDSLTIQNAEVAGDQSAVEANREIWRALAVAALLMLLLEWAVYVKRARYAF